MTPPVFSPDALTTFRSLYPNVPGLIRHDLCDHPLFQLRALAALAERMRPQDVEYNRADLPIGVDPKDVPANGLGIGDTIRTIAENGSWMVLKFVEQDALYRILLEEILHELEPAVASATGEMMKKEGFIFLSSPNAVTPFHFDPEHNILLQICGNKEMTIFPARDPDIVHGIHHEQFHQGSHRNLPWHDDFTAKGRTFPLAPGDALHVPVKAPHWVKNGPALSISFSITWRSLWSYQEADAHGLNRILRSAGVNPQFPKAFPDMNHGKSIMYRIIRKVTGKY